MTDKSFQNGNAIGVVRPDTFSEDTAQTPGSHRVAAITREHGIPSSMWGGLFIVAAGGQTAIHHHGKQDTVVYVLAGTCLIRWGAMGNSRRPLNRAISHTSPRISLLRRSTSQRIRNSPG